MPTRRSFLRGLAGALTTAAATAARADGKGARPEADPTRAADFLASRTPPDLTVKDFDVEGDRKLATRFLLYVPNHLAKDERVPLLVLFHGLGETWDPTVGVNAWVERYGLGTAYARLRRPPIAHTSRALNLLPDARITEISAQLAANPFRGMAIACPFTPNIQKFPPGALDTYASWVTDVVVPRCRKEAPLLEGRERTAIDGVSLGGYVGIEVFTRRPEAYGVWGGIQSAFNVARIPHYSERMAAAFAKAPPGARPGVHITTSDADPFRETNLALAAALAKKGVAHELSVLSGLHDQVFLRERGSLEMLLWHDRRLR